MQIHTSNDLVSAIGSGTHTFVAKSTGPHTVFVSMQQGPANGKAAFTGNVQLMTAAGVVVFNAPGGCASQTVPLVSGTTYKWSIPSGTPISNVLTNVNDAT
jgi:hypothetical protein